MKTLTNTDYRNLRILRTTTVLAIVLAALQIGTSPAYAGKKKGKAVLGEPPVDFTRNEKITEERKHFQALGPIGIRVNIWSDRSQLTTRTRQFQVREIFQKTPAEGTLKVGDVILGVYSPAGTKDGTFDRDARLALAAAITAAEKKENGGKLVLNVWRPNSVKVSINGQQEKVDMVSIEATKTGNATRVTVKLPVRGSFSATSPWDCEKATNLIDSACQYVLDEIFEKDGKKKGEPIVGINRYLEVLGLLSTGEAKYMPVIQKYVRAICPPEEDLDWSSMRTWGASYKLLLVAEYYYATKDKLVLPHLKELATKLAMGSSGVGTYSHMTTIRGENNGRMYGTSASYGAMNQVSITCTMGLILAQKCGIHNQAIDETVRLGSAFMRWNVDKGIIPYGDHDPFHRWRTVRPEHDNNGKNSQCAVMFNLLGDKVAATYFTRMTLASHYDRENGHTGHFFGRNWGASGAAIGGPEAAQTFVRNTRWFFELERRADGGSVFQNPINFKSKTTGWSTTGARLLMHCLPRKKLLITGKDGSCVEPITGTELKEIVAMANFDAGTYSTPELLKWLGNWSPEVRIAAALELGTRDDNVVKDLISMLKSDNRYARYGACYALKLAGRGSAEAVDALAELVADNPDVTLRFWAATALGLPSSTEPELGQNALSQKDVLRRAAPALLKQLTIFEPKVDPHSKLHGPIARTLFYQNRKQPELCGIFNEGKSLDAVDRKVLMPALKNLLRNPNAYVRQYAASFLPNLNKSDLKHLWSDAYYCAKYRAPSGAMMQNGPRIGCMKLMLNTGFKEVIPLAANMVVQSGWGEKGRWNNIGPILEAYGKAIKPSYPMLDEYVSKKENSKNKRKPGQLARKQGAAYRKYLDKAMKADPPKLISIQKYLKDDPGPLNGRESAADEKESETKAGAK